METKASGVDIYELDQTEKLVLEQRFIDKTKNRYSRKPIPDTPLPEEPNGHPHFIVNEQLVYINNSFIDINT